jgi:threonine/homoserine/homoserine lactone efflux protein
VLHLLLVLVPLGLAASVSPVMLTEQTVLLAGPGGRRVGLMFTAGTALVLVVLVDAVLVLGRSLSLPRAPHLDASFDLFIGGLLLVLAVVLRFWRSPGREDRDTGRRLQQRMSLPAAFAFGVFSMATNVTTIALVVPAAKEIAASQLAIWESLLAVVLLVIAACLPAWGPVALEAAAPQTAGRFLDRLETLIHRHGRLLVVLLVVAAGVYLTVRGSVRLLGM